MNDIGRNEECPCGSGRKYKRCCLGNVDWGRLRGRPFREHIPFLSLRGRNIAFLAELLDALQIDSFAPNTSYAEYKKAFTPNAVRRIYESVPILWPSHADYARCMEREKKDSSALYTGSYEPQDVFAALSRHSLYTERIFLTDPFIDPRRVSAKYNPLNHPEQYRAEAIKWSHMWLSLYPWIQAGIVSFIRPPADFIPGMWQTIYERQHRRFEQPELRQLADAQVEKAVDSISAFDRGTMENFFLRHTDEYFRETYADIPEPKPSLDEFLQYIQKRRDDHPYFVESLENQDGEILIQQTGACYELAKIICAQTNSHVITNLDTRWKEIELDRPNLTGEIALWSPFAKALQNSELQILNSSSLEAALKLRNENRLEGMRLFFRRVWNACKDPNEFLDPNALNLTVELDERVAEAKSEWKKIDQDLFKWFGAAGTALVAGAFANFLPAALAAGVGGTFGMIDAQIKRSAFRERYPAAFFLDLKR